MKLDRVTFRFISDPTGQVVALLSSDADAFGVPIGSHCVPGAAGCVDTTAMNPFNVDKARAVLKEAGVATPLELSLKPLPPCSRQGGEVIAASHVEPFDLGNYAKPGYYRGYESPALARLYEQIANTPRAADRAKSLGDAQRLLATDVPNVFLYQPQWITVANKRVRGLWKDLPVFVNDLAALAWE